VLSRLPDNDHATGQEIAFQKSRDITMDEFLLQLFYAIGAFFSGRLIIWLFGLG